MCAYKHLDAKPRRPPRHQHRQVLRACEDTWHVGKALQKLLEDLGIEVAGPAATVPEAEHLIAESPPTVAFVDVKLRDGELAYSSPWLAAPSSRHDNLATKQRRHRFLPSPDDVRGASPPLVREAHGGIGAP